MDIELRNALGALTAQVNELTKQSKVLDGTLANALDRGAKGAGNLADRTRNAREEMSLVETVSTRMTRAWTNQMFALATGAIGVTAIWQKVSDAINASMEKAEKRAQALRDLANKKPMATPAGYGDMRAAMAAGSSRALSPTARTEALNSYIETGAPTGSSDIERLGRVVSGHYVMGFSPEDLAKKYGSLRKMGVSNPEDVILALSRSGKGDELSKLKPGRAKALASLHLGEWNKATFENSRRMSPEDRVGFEAWAKAGVEANNDIEIAAAKARDVDRWRMLRGFTGDDTPLVDRANKFARPGPWGVMMSPTSIQRINQAFPGKSMEDVAAYIDKTIERAGPDLGQYRDLLPQAVPTPAQPQPEPQPIVPPAPWGSTVPRYKVPPPPSTSGQVIPVLIVGDARPTPPMPVNAGD